MAENKKSLRTPIVCVMGHVDHGKTTLLDRIRGTAVVDREAGAITQHIGATEVPMSTISRICGGLMEDKKFTVPGLLFIDTPGHHSFTTLRSRGGALADLAVLVVDINEGFKPQTYEVIKILRRFTTPFVVAANKIDRIHGWRSEEDQQFVLSYRQQNDGVKQIVDLKTYELVGKLHEEGFSSDRYDRVSDFRKNLGIIPVSARTGEGVPDLLMVLVGLAQRFLEDYLKVDEKISGVGSILEVKEEKGHGTTLDVILYDGEISIGDAIVIGGKREPIVSKVRALLKPKSLSELRVEKRFQRVKNVTAAAGIKIAAPDIDDAMPGLPLRVVRGGEDLECVIKEVESEISELKVATEQTGIIIKADTLGSLEALASELKNAGVPIQKADVGDISRRDVVDASTNKDEFLSVIIGFNVAILPDAKDEIINSDVQVFAGPIIYKLLEDYFEWVDERKRLIERKQMEVVIRPGAFKILPDCIFRVSKPAIVGVRVIGGVIKNGIPLMREDGVKVGTIKGLQSKGERIESAAKGDEVAVAIGEPTIGRQIKENDILYVDIPESHAKALGKELYDTLSEDEMSTLETFLKIKRQDKEFWGS